MLHTYELYVRAIVPVRALKVQLYSPGGASVLTQLMRCSMSPHESGL